jgi:hypothetical protein
MTAPQLPDDLGHELHAIVHTAALRRYPGLCDRITALVRAAFARQPDPGLHRAEDKRKRFRELFGDREPMRIGDGSPLPSDRECPDGGACHHGCTTGCFRVAWAGPLSGVFPGDTWPAGIIAEYGTQDGVL